MNDIEHEIEITPEMIAAGVRSFRSDVADDGATLFADEEIVRRLLSAALSQRSRPS